MATQDDLIEIQITGEELRAAIEFGKKRTAENEKRGWKNRHHGKKSEVAHAIGEIGELAFSKYLTQNGIPFAQAEKLVSRLSLIKQDFRVGPISIGVKTCSVYSVSGIFSSGSFLYPAKSRPGESFRVLGYPHVLVQAAVDLEAGQAWLVGAIGKEAIMDSPIKEIGGFPAHVIPCESYKRLESLIDYLKRQLGL